MPLYEYRCRLCETEFEVIQKVSDPPLEDCRSCDGKVDKLISRSAFQFKGTGWYVTDYAKKGKDESKSGKSADSDSSAPTMLKIRVATSGVPGGFCNSNST